MSFSWFTPNPLGILPEGNAVDAKEPPIGFARPGSAIANLPVAILANEVIPFLTPMALSNVSCCNWHWYAASNFPEAWKTLFLALAVEATDRATALGKTKSEGGGGEDAAVSSARQPDQLQSASNNNDGDWDVSNFFSKWTADEKILFEHNWKTFVIRYCCCSSKNKMTPPRPLHYHDYVHRPLAPQKRRSALCSDSHFQSWLCTLLPPDFSGKHRETRYLRFNAVAEREYDRCSPDEFRRDFEWPNLPCILKNGAKEWPLFKILDGKFENLRDKASEIFKDGFDPFTEKFRCESVDISLDSYCAYAEAQQDERPVYLFDAHFQEVFRENLWWVPPHFARDDLFAALGKSRPLNRWLIAGPAKSGSSMHVDPNLSAAINISCVGKKRWLMFPPNVTPPGIHPSADMSEVAAPASISEWFFSFYDEALHKLSSVGYECVADAGDIVYVPYGWWHCVINLEPSIALTQNFVSECNLKPVLRFLRCLKNAITGIGDEECDQMKRFIDEDENQNLLLKGGEGENVAGAGGDDANKKAVMQQQQSHRPETRTQGFSLLEKKQQNFCKVFGRAVSAYRPDLAHYVVEEIAEAEDIHEKAVRRRREREELTAALRLPASTTATTNGSAAASSSSATTGGPSAPSNDAVAGFTFNFE